VEARWTRASKDAALIEEKEQGATDVAEIIGDDIDVKEGGLSEKTIDP